MNYFIDFIYVCGGFKNFTNPYTKEDFEAWIAHENKVGNKVVFANENHAKVYINY